MVVDSGLGFMQCHVKFFTQRLLVYTQRVTPLSAFFLFSKNDCYQVKTYTMQDMYVSWCLQLAIQLNK